MDFQGKRNIYIMHNHQVINRETGNKANSLTNIPKIFP